MLVAHRSAADQDTATASSIAAALLSYYTIAQVDGLLAGKLGVTEAALALQIAVRFPDDGGAEVVAAIGEHWAPRTSHCQTGRVAPAAWSWPRTPREWGRRRCRPRTCTPRSWRPRRAGSGRRRGALGLASSCSSTGSPPGSGCSRPRYCTAALWASRAPGARPRCTSQCLRTELRSCTSAPAQPDGRNGGRLRPPDPGRNPGGRQHGGGGHGGLGCAAEARVP